VAVLATGNHFVLDIFGGLVTISASVLLVRLGERWRGSLGISRLRALAPWGRRQVPVERHSAGGRGSLADPARPAYRMSQSCYEVQDQVD
jgi:hypothetical protein